MTTLQIESQKLSTDAFVSLYSLDTTSLGGPVLYFMPSKKTDGSSVQFAGITYVAVDIEFSGLEVNGQGALPTPSIKLANTDGYWRQILNTYGDLVGCTLTRIRTYKKFLDGESDADPGSYYGPDIFKVERLTSDNNVYLQWELSASIDQEGVKLPRRTVIRDTCLWRYRIWTGSAFDYTDVLCPYTGDSYFDINDQPVTDPSQDVPSRRKGCCVARFGNGARPFGGFPGVGRGAS